MNENTEAWSVPWSSWHRTQVMSGPGQDLVPRWSQFSSVTFSLSVVSNSFRPHGLQQARHPYPSPIPGAYSNSRPSSQWCHPTISSSVIPFSSHLQSFSASGSFPMSRLFASGGQSIGVSASASVYPVNIPLGLTGEISLQSKELQYTAIYIIFYIQLFPLIHSFYFQSFTYLWSTTVWKYQTENSRNKQFTFKFFAIPRNVMKSFAVLLHPSEDP